MCQLVVDDTDHAMYNIQHAGLNNIIRKARLTGLQIIAARSE